MTKLDTTGRTNGAGDHFWVAGKEYVWVIGDDGQLVAERFDAETFQRDIEALRRKLGAFLGPIPVDSVSIVPSVADSTAPTAAELENGIDITDHFERGDA